MKRRKVQDCSSESSNGKEANGNRSQRKRSPHTIGRSIRKQLRTPTFEKVASTHNHGGLLLAVSSKTSQSVGAFKASSGIMAK